mmetsp:Transcript_107786/g.337535  ORF Transcript_107786/g.337535 Transcript_107786/m.337535 type:complete len:526 (+) Transcript_107786:283-1860(+)
MAAGNPSASSRVCSRASAAPRRARLADHLGVHVAARGAADARSLHELRDTLCELAGVLDGVAADKRGRLVEHENHVLGLVGVGRLLHGSLDLPDHGVLGVDLQDGLVPRADGEGAVGGAGRRLGLHVALHHGRHAPLALHQRCRGVHEALADLDLLDALAELLLQPGGEALELLDRVLHLLLLILALLEVEARLVDVHELLALEVDDALAADLVQGVHHVEDLVALRPHHLHRGGDLGGPLALARDEVDLVLALLHAGDVLREAGHVVAAPGGPEAHEALEFILVVEVLDETDLEVLAVAAPELLVLLGLLLPEVVDAVQDLAHDALADDLQRPALLQDLAADVQGQVLGVDDAPGEGQPPRHQVLELVVDEDPLDVEAHGPPTLRKHVAGELEGHGGGDEDQRAELDLALDLEVRRGEGLVEGLEGGLVELGVLGLVHDVGVPQPDGLHLVHDLPLEDGARHALHLRLLALLGRGRGVVHDLVVLDLLVPELNGEGDELAVLLQEVRQLATVEILLGLLLEVQN